MIWKISIKAKKVDSQRRVPKIVSCFILRVDAVWPCIFLIGLDSFDWLRKDLNTSHNPSSLIFLLITTPFSYFFPSYFNSILYDLVFIIWLQDRVFTLSSISLDRTSLSQDLIGIGMMTFTRQNETDHQTISFLLHDDDSLTALRFN